LLGALLVVAGPQETANEVAQGYLYPGEVVTGSYADYLRARRTSLLAQLPTLSVLVHGAWPDVLSAPTAKLDKMRTALIGAMDEQIASEALREAEGSV
jgi:hypothetical protein